MRGCQFSNIVSYSSSATSSPDMTRPRRRWPGRSSSWPTTPRAQEVLRRHLQTVYGTACAEQRDPTAAEIVKTAAPYLDAFLEECLRMTRTLNALLREAVVDTAVLGHAVPKGTPVFMHVRGPGVTAPAVPVDAARRSEATRASAARVGAWDEGDLARVPAREVAEAERRRGWQRRLLHL